MDLTEPSLAARKAELIRSLDRCRQAMEVGADEVVSALDLREQFRASFASSSWQWLTASLAAGVLTGLLLSSRAGDPKTSKNGGAASGTGGRLAKVLLRGAFENLAKPALQGLLQGKGEQWFWRILEKSGS